MGGVEEEAREGRGRGVVVIVEVGEGGEAEEDKEEEEMEGEEEGGDGREMLWWVMGESDVSSWNTLRALWRR